VAGAHERPHLNAGQFLDQCHQAPAHRRLELVARMKLAPAPPRAIEGEGAAPDRQQSQECQRARAARPAPGPPSSVPAVRPAVPLACLRHPVDEIGEQRWRLLPGWASRASAASRPASPRGSSVLAAHLAARPAPRACPVA
jgi:hypothetical protein